MAARQKAVNESLLKGPVKAFSLAVKPIHLLSLFDCVTFSLEEEQKDCFHL